MIGIALLAGFLGGAWHLVVTAGRARAVASGSVGLLFLLAPIGLLGPVLALVGILAVAPGAAWAVLPGLLLARLLLVGPLSRGVEVHRWR